MKVVEFMTGRVCKLAGMDYTLAQMVKAPNILERKIQTQLESDKL